MIKNAIILPILIVILPILVQSQSDSCYLQLLELSTETSPENIVHDSFNLTITSCFHELDDAQLLRLADTLLRQNIITRNPGLTEFVLLRTCKHLKSKGHNLASTYILLMVIHEYSISINDYNLWRTYFEASSSLLMDYSRSTTKMSSALKLARMANAGVIRDHPNDLKNIAQTEIQIARALAHISYDSAKAYFDHLEQKYSHLDTTILAKIYEHRAVMENANKNYIEAINYYFKLNDTNKSIKLPHHHGLGVAYRNAGYYEKAMKIFRYHLEKAKTIKKDIARSIPMINIGITHYLQNHYDSSLIYFNQAYDLSLASNSAFHIEECYKYLTKLYKKRPDIQAENQLILKYVDWLEYQTEYNELILQTFLNSSIHVSNLNRDLDEITKHSRLQILVSTFIISLLLLITLLIIRFYRIKNRLTKVKLMLKEHTMTTDQYKPHLIQNILQRSIIKSIQLKDSSNSSHLTQSIKFLKNSLVSMSYDFISLESEIKHIKRYLELVRQTLPKLDFKISHSSSISNKTTILPTGIIIPFVENAIKHAFSEDLDNPQLNIACNATEAQTTILVEDNGPGFDTEKLTYESHHGLGFTAKRVEVLNFLLETNITFDIQSDEKGTRVSITIPRISDEKISDLNLHVEPPNIPS